MVPVPGINETTAADVRVDDLAFLSKVLHGHVQVVHSFVRVSYVVLLGLRLPHEVNQFPVRRRYDDGMVDGRFEFIIRRAEPQEGFFGHAGPRPFQSLEALESQVSFQVEPSLGEAPLDLVILMLCPINYLFVFGQGFLKCCELLSGEDLGIEVVDSYLERCEVLELRCDRWYSWR